jgi:outer membrane protein TolC
MASANFRRLPRLLGARGFALGLWAGCSAFTAGCEHAAPVVRLQAPTANAPVVSVQRPAAAASSRGIVQAAHQAEAAAPRTVPINIDTVLRLAEEQNAQIGVARERVDESLAENEIAARAWLPKVYAGVGYFRHEGGIQNEDGTLTRSSFGSLFPGVEIRGQLDLREATYNRVNAERKVWQQKGELTKITNETLVEAASTYFDLLTARRAEVVLRSMERYDDDLLKRAKDLQKDVGDILIENVRVEVTGRKQVLAKLHQQGDAASAKLVYLLGLDPQAQLVPTDDVPAPIDAIDVSPDSAALVERALTSGPGVAVLQDGMAQLEGPKRFVPKIELTATEGLFMAGPGSQLDSANRFDLGLQARWNLTDFITAQEQRRAQTSRMQQAQLSYVDLRGKLALSVEEARTAILSGREQIKFGEEQVRHADRTLELSNTRLKENVPGSSTTEVVQSLRILEFAHVAYLQAIAAHNKAQIRLMLLLGSGACQK